MICLITWAYVAHDILKFQIHFFLHCLIFNWKIVDCKFVKGSWIHAQIDTGLAPVSQLACVVAGPNYVYLSSGRSTEVSPYPVFQRLELKSNIFGCRFGLPTLPANGLPLHEGSVYMYVISKMVLPSYEIASLPYIFLMK